MARTFQPLGDRIVIKPIEQEEVSKGGLVLPDTARERPQEGEVIAAGPGRLTDEGNRIPMELVVGDKVLYAKYAGTELKEDDEDYLVLRESDILAKIS
ncbi:MAG: co-chaperone GroES [Dehalococcoidia bacterium]|nr:co-chaperone GroES [Dehalococcoidia bacterium]